MLDNGVSHGGTYHANVDLNKVGNLKFGDQGLQPNLIVPPGQCL